MKGFLTLTLALSLRERGQIECGLASLLSGTDSPFSLSPGERAGVRGK